MTKNASDLISREELFRIWATEYLRHISKFGKTDRYENDHEFPEFKEFYDRMTDEPVEFWADSFNEALARPKITIQIDGKTVAEC